MFPDKFVDPGVILFWTILATAQPKVVENERENKISLRRGKCYLHDTSSVMMFSMTDPAKTGFFILAYGGSILQRTHCGINITRHLQNEQ